MNDLCKICRSRNTSLCESCEVMAIEIAKEEEDVKEETFSTETTYENAKEKNK